MPFCVWWNAFRPISGSSKCTRPDKMWAHSAYPLFSLVRAESVCWFVCLWCRLELHGKWSDVRLSCMGIIEWCGVCRRSAHHSTVLLCVYMHIHFLGQAHDKLQLMLRCTHLPAASTRENACLRWVTADVTNYRSLFCALYIPIKYFYSVMWY